MDSMVAMGIALVSVSLPFMLAYGWRRFSRWVAQRNLEHYDTDMWAWDNLAAADVRDYEDHVRRQNES